MIGFAAEEIDQGAPTRGCPGPAARCWWRTRTPCAQTAADGLEYYAVSIVGPRNPVDKIVGKLPLL